MKAVVIYRIGRKGEAEEACRLAMSNREIVTSRSCRESAFILSTPLEDDRGAPVTRQDGVAFLKILARYYSGSFLRASEYEEPNSTKTFCPTGPGGGVDPHCGGGGGMFEAALTRSSEQASELEERLRTDIDDETQKGVYLYTGPAHADINRHLRSDPKSGLATYRPSKAYFDEVGAPDDFKELTENPEYLKSLQKEAKSKLKEPVVVFRGIGGENSFLGKAKPGSTVESFGLTSTSLKLSTTYDFLATGDSPGTVLEIKAKTGLIAGEHSQMGGQFELIQAHGTKYKVLGVKENVELSFDGTPVKVRRVIQMEEI